MKVRFPTINVHKEEISEEEALALRALGQNPKIVKEISTVVIELDDISMWFSENNTTVLILKNGREEVIDLDEPAFSVLYVDLTSDLIKSIEYTRTNIGEIEDEDENEEDNGFN